MYKKYFVSYFHWTNGKSSGFGNRYIEEGENEDIYTENEIIAIQKSIIDSNGFSGCVILSIIPLNA